MKYVALILLIVSIIFSSCTEKKPDILTGSYYWQNSKSLLTDNEYDGIKNIHPDKLYIKFFEVEKDDVFGNKPVAKSRLLIPDMKYWNSFSKDTVLRNIMRNLKIIPVIFIENKVFKEIRTNYIDTLALNIVFLIEKYFNNIKYNNQSIEEIQIDCDWTLSTKNEYFLLLEKIRNIIDYKISCTLRLYPYKYQSNMGIPPVDKVSLMCYNFFSPLERGYENSIQNNNEMLKYIKDVKSYPLQTDIILPLFSWIQVYKDNSFVYLIKDDIQLDDFCKLQKPMWYEVLKDTMINGHFLRKSDLLKKEEISKTELLKTAELLSKYVKLQDGFTVSFFHLNDKISKDYDENFFNNIISNFK